ncbi:MAG: hypothetical protein PHS57_06245 [Alphaproteobacteria bacterium]|nr:hypothetical protein [Alphaproteobacteria bacterium]
MKQEINASTIREIIGREIGEYAFGHTKVSVDKTATGMDVWVYGDYYGHYDFRKGKFTNVK